MNLRRLTLAALTLCTTALTYPPSPAGTATDTLHGVVVPDPYRWLENPRSPAVQHWESAEDSLARAVLGGLPDRAEIAARLHQLMYIEDVSSPLHRGNRYFYKRRRADQEKAVLYWKEGPNGKERILLDPNTWTSSGNASLGEWVPSWDGRSVAYTMNRNNADEATLHVIDVASGKRSDVDVIDGARYATPSWTASGDGFYYTWIPMDSTIADADRPGYAEVRFHRLGQDPKQDRVVRERTGDPAVFVDGRLSRDGHWLFLVVSHGWNSTDLYFRDMRRGSDEPFQPLTVGQDAHYFVRDFKDRFYVLTDEGASRSRLFRIDPARPDRGSWREIVPERQDATLDDFTIAGRRLVLTYIRDASSRIEIRELDGTGARVVALPGIGAVKDIKGNDDEDEAYFNFASFTTPKEIYQLSIRSGATEIWNRLDIPVDSTPYTVEQVFYPSRDGTRVPMFLVHRKDLRKDGTSRALLTGYGGFQVSMTPYFSPRALLWIERGGVYAVACLRGGNEYGESWHRAGMLLQKQNVFDDFIAGAEYLVRERYTTTGRLAISGGSNGGLLVGAKLTQRPELFRAVLCGSPLLDMVRYHQFGSGATWTSEYGSAADPDQFRAIHAYSPYHHLRKGVRYPAVLMLSTDSDDRVDPMHARKFAAALQNASTGGPVLLRVERQAGHGGADLIRSTVEESADAYSFLFAETPEAAP